MGDVVSIFEAKKSKKREETRKPERPPIFEGRQEAIIVSFSEENALAIRRERETLKRWFIAMRMSDHARARFNSKRRVLRRAILSVCLLLRQTMGGMSNAYNLATMPEETGVDSKYWKVDFQTKFRYQTLGLANVHERHGRTDEAKFLRAVAKDFRLKKGSLLTVNGRFNLSTMDTEEVMEFSAELLISWLHKQLKAEAAGEYVIWPLFRKVEGAKEALMR